MNKTDLGTFRAKNNILAGVASTWANGASFMLLAGGLGMVVWAVLR